MNSTSISTFVTVVLLKRNERWDELRAGKDNYFSAAKIANLIHHSGMRNPNSQIQIESENTIREGPRMFPFYDPDNQFHKAHLVKKYPILPRWMSPENQSILTIVQNLLCLNIIVDGRQRNNHTQSLSEVVITKKLMKMFESNLNQFNPTLCKFVRLQKIIFIEFSPS